MTLDDYFRDQISRGQPPLVALNNAAQAYADRLRKRPDCSQYADETAAWGEQQDLQVVKIHQRLRSLISSTNYGGCRVFSIGEQCQCPLCDLDRLFQATRYDLDRLFRETSNDRIIEAVELLLEARNLLKNASDRPTWTTQKTAWLVRVGNFLEGKQ